MCQFTPGFEGEFGTGTNLSADDSTVLSQPGGTTDPDAVQQFWSLHSQVETRLAKYQQSPASRGTGENQLAWMIDKAAVVFHYEAAGPSRILALRLAMGNRSKSALTIRLSSITAEIDGEAHKLEPLPEELRYHGFTYDDVMHRLEACMPPAEMVIPPGGVASAWLIFPHLENATTVPRTILHIAMKPGPIDIDANAQQRAILGLEVDRLGPQDGLVLLTIHGPMNTFNIQSIVDELAAQAAQRVARAVIRFAPEAPAPDSQMETWLFNCMANAGTDRPASEQLPSISGQIRELHLVQSPNANLNDSRGMLLPSVNARVHANDADAVAAALKTLFFTASLDELRQRMQQGHPLARAATLIYGSQRLTVADLPLILNYSRSDEVLIRQAAIQGLREFSESAALARLEEVIRQGDPADASIAILALADSRFTAARDRLEQLSRDRDPLIVEAVISTLAAHPRPAWTQTLFELAHRSTGEIRPEVLRALVQLDHPQIVELLGEGLKSRDESLSDLCFSLLSKRSDEQSYQLARPYAWESLNQGKIDSDLLEFVSRTRNPGLVTALERRLSDSDHRAQIIQLLGQIGQQSASQQILRGYPQYNAEEQAAAMGALRNLQHPQFLPLATQAMAEGELVVRQRAIQELLLDGSPQAEQILCETFVKNQAPQLAMNLANALANLGTPEAREALKTGANSQHESLQLAARQGLFHLRASSPGYNYFGQGLAHAQQRQWVAAIELFKVAIELDPYLTEAHMSLGDAYLKLEKWKLAEKYYGKARELEPENSNIITGQAIAWVMLNRLDDALKLIQSYRANFEKDNIFRYNAACVYGRGIEILQQQPETAERQARIREFQQLALDDLKASIEYGFNQLRWMQQDPDLKTLRMLPEFAAIVAEAQKKQPETDPTKPVPDDK